MHGQQNIKRILLITCSSFRTNRISCIDVGIWEIRGVILMKTRGHNFCGRDLEAGGVESCSLLGLVLLLRIFVTGAPVSNVCRLPYTHKVKWSHYRPGVAQRVGRGIALLFLDRGTRSGWVVSSKPRPHFTPGKDPVPILQEACWAPGPVWTGGKSRPHRDSIPDRPACSQSLYRLSYPAQTSHTYMNKNEWEYG